MTTTKQYDYLNRLTQISSAPSGAGLLPYTYAYNYNPANQRTRNTFSDGSHWSYQYDWLGQVTNGGRYWSDGTLVAGQQYQYLFDTIGNRTKTWMGGDTNGANLRPAVYSVNSVNQIKQRDVPGTNDVIGAALVGTNVTVNGVAADRKAEYFHGVVGTNNASQPFWLTSTIIGANNTLSGHFYVAKEPEQFQYDLDGNLTTDGRWSYTWDGENRLIGMTVSTSAGPLYQLTFAYDWQGRRIQKVSVTNGVTIATCNFLYDGWNLEAEMGSSGTLVRSYVWGADLSGSPQGAGGVGGLVETRYYGTATTNAFAAFDGNGNVSALVNAADGTVVANYEYGPFGEVIRNSGPMAKNNPLRFSTKYQDDESDLLYYGYRYLNAVVGRWIGRDPVHENGGNNLYAADVNDPINGFDPNGRVTIKRLEYSEAFECLREDLYYNIKLDTTPNASGYIVQHLRITETGNDCSGGPVASKTYDFYESLMHVKVNLNESWRVTDLNELYYLTDQGQGNITITREVNVYDEALTGDLPRLWSRSGIPHFRTGPISLTKPWWWSAGNEATASNKAELTYHCCCNAKRPPVFYDTAPGAPITIWPY
jgi:RHS repeat-associated protein